MRKVEAVNSRSYFLIKSLTDLRRGAGMMSLILIRGPNLPPRTSPFRHVWAAGVSGPTLSRVVQPSGLFHDEVTKPVVSITLRQDEREQKIKDNFSVIHRVSRNICNEPMPELGQGPGGFIVRIIVIFSSLSDLLLIILKTIDFPQTTSRYGIGSTELSCLSSLHLKLSNSLTRASWFYSLHYTQ